MFVSIFSCDVLADAADAPAATDTGEKNKAKRPPAPGECDVVPFLTQTAAHLSIHIACISVWDVCRCEMSKGPSVKIQGQTYW
jgi:hypothetical protein